MRAKTPAGLPGYQSIYDEVVTVDSYGLRKLDFVPDVIFDLGANMGCFTRFAQELFPQALVVAVEPDNDNYANLVAFTPKRLNNVFLQYAIGSGRVYENINTVDKNGPGAHGCFLSTGLGYPEELMEKDSRVVPCSVPTRRVSDLFDQYVKPGDKVLVKIDIEGNEHTIFTHGPSMECLRSAEYVAIEIHKYAIDHAHQDEVNERVDEALKSFESTHEITWNHVVFQARKR